MRIVVAAWDSGGGVEVTEHVLRRCVGAGHDVRVLGTEGLRSRLGATGATFVAYRHAPDNDRSRPETDLLKDWETKNPVDSFARVRDRVLFGPASQFCRDVTEALAAEPADVVLVDILVASALCAAEAAGVPRALLVHALYGIPRAGATPLGAGLLPPTNGAARVRDRALGRLTTRLLAGGLPALNAARRELGLHLYDSPLELFDLVPRILVCSSPSYDFSSESAPGNVVYVGPQFDDAPPGHWDDPWPGDTTTPLVVVAASSTFMDQRTMLQAAADALGRLPVHALVTTGSTVDPDDLSAPPNVVVRRWVRHADVLPATAVLVTHGGHGTVIKTLAAGVPMVVVPAGRDQPDNAARVVHAGAGLRVKGRPTADRLARAVGAVLDDPVFAAAARAMAARLADERDDHRVVVELEAVAAGAPPAVRPRPRPRDVAAPTNVDTGAGPRPGRGRRGGAVETLGFGTDVRRRTVTAPDGGRLHVVVDDGPEPTVVFLHGVGMSGEIWARQFSGLRGHHQLVAADLRGAGASTPGSAGTTLAAMVDDLFAVLDDVGVRHGLLVGHSLGAIVALEAALTRADRLSAHVDALVLVGTTGGIVPATASGPVKRAVVETGMRAVERLHFLKRMPGLLALGTRLSFGPRRPGDAERALVARLLMSGPDTGPEMMTLLSGYDTRSRIGDVDIPVVVAAGTRDNFMPFAHVRRFAEALPGAELVPFEQAGHVPMLEDAADFGALLTRVAAQRCGAVKTAADGPQ